MYTVNERSNHAQTALSLIEQDPILYTLSSYQQAREQNRVVVKANDTAVLSSAMQYGSTVADFCREVLNILEVLQESAIDGYCYPDPTFSTVVRAWIGGLARGLEWAQIGADPALLNYFTDLHAFKHDLCLEYVDYSNRNDSDREEVEGCTIHNCFRLVPVQALSKSPRLSQRVQECFPGFPHDGYIPVDAQTIDKVAEHLSQALDCIRTLSPIAYQGVAANVHTFFVTLLKGSKNSFGSRFDCPGTVLIGLSEQRLRDKDIISTAAQLYHEHCHVKLSLHYSQLTKPLPTELVWISPFKNEIREIETLLHTAYTIAIECIFLLTMLEQENERSRMRKIAYLAAVGARLELTTEILEAGLPSDAPIEYKRVPSLARQTIAQIKEVLKTVPLKMQRLHERERQSVLERHVWDISQFLLRGVVVQDPDLSNVAFQDAQVRFQFRGKEHRAVLEEARVSYGNYGSYIENLL